MLNRRLIAASLMFALVATSTTLGQVVFTEDFEGASPPLLPSGWTTVDGNAGGTNNPDFQTVDEGGNTVLSQLNTELDTGSGTAATMGGIALAPGTYDSIILEFDLRIDEAGSGNGAPDAAIAFGYQNSGEYYMVIFNGAAENNEAFTVFDNSPGDGVPDGRTQIGGDFDYSGLGGVPFTDGTVFHEVQVTHAPSVGLISINIDGASVFSEFNSDFGGGSVGFGAVNDSATFDNIVITAVEPGDTNLDGLVDLATDFAAIRDNFKAAGNRVQGDLTGDNFVDYTDFRIWKTDFLAGGGSLTGVDVSFLTVPEPSSGVIAFMVLAAGSFIRLRYR